MILAKPELLELCPACGSPELRRDTTTGDLDCVNCGELVEAGPFGVVELEDDDEVLR